jgi:uncharacterized protein (TIGR02231 family)
LTWKRFYVFNRDVLNPRGKEMSNLATRYLTAVLAILSLTAAFPAPGVPAGKPAEAELKTSVITATIYRGQVQVRRSGAVTLKSGQVRIFCDDLPSGFDAASLQVEGHGTAKVGIIGTDAIRVQEDPAENPRYTELYKKLEALVARRDSIDIEVNALQVRLQFVEQLGRLPMQQTQAKEFPSEIFQVDGWKALMDFLQSERTGADERVYALNRKKQKTEEDINWIKREMQLIKQGNRSGYRVAIDVAVESAGDLTLELTYIVPGAEWVPEYRIGFDHKNKEVALVYNARIRQTTGEDWKDVDVTLSTAMPHAGAAPPELQPYYLSQRMLRAKKSLIIEDRAESLTEAEELYPGMPDEGLPVRGGRAGYVEAEVASSEFAASFHVPARIDLETGADSKRIRITGGEMPAVLSLYTAPRLRSDVFVKGLVTNTLGAPILAGVAEVYIDTEAPGGGKSSTFVGRQQLETFAGGQEFPLHLGVDQDVKVEHKLEKREYVEKEGKKWRKIRYHYLITLENFKKEAAEVVLQDRVPVSTLKEVKVEDVDIAPKPDESGEDGIMTWNLKPEAGGKIEIRISYTIAMPGEWPEHTINLE